MKDAILLELANRWEAEAKEPGPEDGSPQAEAGNAKRRGGREARRECADTLRMLVGMIGEVGGSDPCSDNRDVTGHR